jgi:enoyl-CoA hydratase
VAIGLTLPHAAIEILRARLTPAAFNRAAILAEPFTPVEAVAAGFLDRVVDPGAFAGAVEETATALAALDGAAHRATKARVRGATLRALRAAIDADVDASAADLLG